MQDLPLQLIGEVVMKVKMILQTRWEGEVLKPGDTAEVESNTAHRWINRGIAEPVTGVSIPAETPDITEPVSTELEDLKYNDLRGIASEKNITVPKGTKKQELIALIREAEGVPAETNDESAAEKKTD